MVTGDRGLFDGLGLQMEVWNAGNLEVPSHRIYSALGPIQALKMAMANAPPTVALRLCATKQKDVAGPAFSAADLDPVHRRYPTITECIDTAHEVSNPLNFCVRMTVLDRQTGRMALV